MDISGARRIKHFWSYDKDTDLLTITFKSDDESTIIGDIIIEGKRSRGLLESLLEINKLFFPNVNNTLDREFCRTDYDNRDGKATMEFE